MVWERRIEKRAKTADFFLSFFIHIFSFLFASSCVCMRSNLGSRPVISNMSEWGTPMLTTFNDCEVHWSNGSFSPAAEKDAASRFPVLPKKKERKRFPSCYKRNTERYGWNAANINFFGVPGDFRGKPRDEKIARAIKKFSLSAPFISLFFWFFFPFFSSFFLLCWMSGVISFHFVKGGSEKPQWVKNFPTKTRIYKKNYAIRISW